MNVSADETPGNEAGYEPWCCVVADWTDVVSVVTTGLGLVGNALAFVTASRMQDKHCTPSARLCVKAIAIADSVAIFQDGFMYTALKLWFGLILSRTSSVLCKLIVWHSLASNVAASALLVLFTADRFFAVRHPILYKNKFTSRRAVAGCVSVYALSYLQLGYLAYFWGLEEGRCLPVNHVRLYPYFEMYGNVICWTVAPGLAICAMNFLIIKRLRERARKKSGGSQSTADMRHANSTTSQLLVVSGFFVLDSIAAAICMYMYIDQSTMPHYTEETARDMRELWLALFRLSSILNCSVNFYLYILAAPTFRHSFLCIVCPRMRSFSVATQ